MELLIYLDENSSSLDLTKYTDLKNVKFIGDTEVENLTIFFKDLYIIKNIKQFQNLKYLTIESEHKGQKNYTKNKDFKIVNFGIYHNLTKLNIKYISDKYNIEKILLTNLINLEELKIRSIPKLKEKIDLKDCIKLRILDVRDPYILFNQPSIEILSINKFLEDNYIDINLKQLTNLKEFHYSAMNGTDYIDLSNQTKLIKLSSNNGHIRGISENIEYLSISGSLNYMDRFGFIDMKKIEKMTKLKYLNIKYSRAFEGEYPTIYCNEIDLINLKELEELNSIGGDIFKNINVGIKKINLLTYDNYYDDEVTLNMNNERFINYDITLYNKLTEMKNLEYLKLYNFSTTELNITNCIKLTTLILKNCSQLEKIIFPYNYKEDFIVKNLPSLINLVTSRRRIYLLAETKGAVVDGLCESKVGTPKGLSETKGAVVDQTAESKVGVPEEVAESLIKEECKVFCKKCKRYVNRNNIINFRKYDNNLYANTCC